MLTVIVFVIILGVLIFAHELGHFLTARMFGVKAKEFGFGLPPRICGWRKVNGKRKFFWGSKPSDEIESESTIISINWLPLGGFVDIKGEDGSGKDEVDSFMYKKAWQRLIIISAGVLMNIILAMVLLSATFAVGAPQVIDDLDPNTKVRDEKVQILQVLPESPADLAGLEVGDQVLAVDGQYDKSVAEIQEYLASKQDQTVVLQISRFGEEIQSEVVPTYYEDQQKAIVGVALVKSGIVSYPWYKSIWLGIKSTILLIGTILYAFYTIIKNLLVGLPAGIDVAGPVGIAVMTGQVTRLGFSYVLQFAAILSINLAIINFLPFPALDGSKFILIILEKIRRRPINQKLEQKIHTVGFIILIMLFIFITGRDIFNYFAK